MLPSVQSYLKNDMAQKLWIGCNCSLWYVPLTGCDDYFSNVWSRRRQLCTLLCSEAINFRHYKKHHCLPFYYNGWIHRGVGLKLCTPLFLHFLPCRIFFGCHITSEITEAQYIYSLVGISCNVWTYCLCLAWMPPSIRFLLTQSKHLGITRTGAIQIHHYIYRCQFGCMNWPAIWKTL